MPDEPGAWNHLDRAGRARMVDVSAKADTLRTATAEGRIVMRAATRAVLLAGELPKGDALATARVAAIQAAKRTPELIPLCHPLRLSAVEVAFAAEGDDALHVAATVTARDATGVEMEALTAVAVACLTVYDMAKSADRGMRIEGLRLCAKTGGRSGAWRADDETGA